MGLTIIFASVALFALLYIVAGLKIVKQSEVVIIERFGKYHSTLNSGINLILPVVDKARPIIWRYVVEGLQGQKLVRFRENTRIDLRETVYDFPKQNVITKDNVVVQINAVLYFQVMDPIKAMYEISNLPDAIEKLTQTTLRNVIGELELDESLSSRDTINTKLRAILDDATNKWGVKVNRVELQDINPPQDIKEAMEKQMRAERDRRAAVLEAEGLKRAAILDAEGQRESEIAKAEGDRQAAILEADGQAQARIKVAEAEAAAIELIKKAVGGDKDPIQYLVATRYLETFEAFAEGQDNKTVFMPFEASGVLSSLGGIKELLKNT